MTSIPFSARRITASLVCAGMLAGCGLLRTAADAVIPGAKKNAPSPDALQSDLMRYSDLIVFRVDEATHQFETLANSPDAYLQASRWRLDALRLTTQLTTEPNSFSGLLDLMVLATTMAWLQDDYTIPEVWGEAARPMSIAMKTTEEDGWTLLERYLPKERIEQVHGLLAAWREEHPKLEREALLEFPSFSAIAEKLSAAKIKDPSLLAFVGLDPLAGLEPASRQVEQARQFGQRALFFAQRAPRLVGAEVEYRTLCARDSKEVKQVLANTERITTSLESFGVTAAGLREAVGTEREAAVKQIADELTAQREGLVQDLAQAQAPLANLMQEAKDTLAAGQSTSLELANTLRTFDTVAARFDKPAEPAASEPGPPHKPFDVSEYGAAAERVGKAAVELNALLTAFDQRVPEAQRLLNEAAARGESTVDHALLRAGEVGLALIAAAALAAWLVRRSGTRARTAEPDAPVRAGSRSVRPA